MQIDTSNQASEQRNSVAASEQEEEDPDLQILEQFKECFKAVSGDALVVDRSQLKDSKFDSIYVF